MQQALLTHTCTPSRPSMHIYAQAAGSLYICTSSRFRWHTNPLQSLFAHAQAGGHICTCTRILSRLRLHSHILQACLHMHMQQVLFADTHAAEPVYTSCTNRRPCYHTQISSKGSGSVSVAICPRYLTFDKNMIFRLNLWQ